MVIERPAVGDVLRILNALRPADEEEYRASLGETPRGQAASQICRATFCWLLATDAPIAFIAANRYLPHRYTLTMAATERWPEVKREANRLIGRAVFPTLWDAGCRRAEAYMVASHEEAARWMARLGARLEAVMPRAGVYQETMLLWSFTDEGEEIDVQRFWRTGPQFRRARMVEAGSGPDIHARPGEP